jgi:transposase
MRYELTDHEWTAIKPMLPNKPRGVARVNDRRVLNGIFWVLRSGAPWRDLPKSFGPYTPATIASFAGAGRASGARSCTRWLAPTMLRCR